MARAARAAKEVIKGQGIRGRKRKSAAQDAEEPEVARMIDAMEGTNPNPLSTSLFQTHLHHLSLRG